MTRDEAVSDIAMRASMLLSEFCGKEWPATPIELMGEINNDLLALSRIHTACDVLKENGVAHPEDAPRQFRETARGLAVLALLLYATADGVSDEPLIPLDGVTFN